MGDGVCRPALERLEFIQAGLVTELNLLPDHAARCLTIRERQRAEGMGPRRLVSYLGSRFTLKMLALHLYPQLRGVGLDTLDTLDLDPALPSLPTPPDLARLFCSVSHDSRWVVAVASPFPVGLDVEAVTDKAWQGAPRFMSQEELRLARGCSMGRAQAATRVWSIKEAASKALGLALPVAWKGVEVAKLGERASRFLVHGRHAAAHHDELDGHLLTVLTTPIADEPKTSSLEA